MVALTSQEVHRAHCLHQAFRALHTFQHLTGRPPKPWDPVSGPVASPPSLCLIGVSAARRQHGSNFDSQRQFPTHIKETINTISRLETGALKVSGTKPGDPCYLLSPQIQVRSCVHVGEASRAVVWLWESSAGAAQSGGRAPVCSTLRLLAPLSVEQGGWLPEGFEWEVEFRLGLLCPWSSTPQADADRVVSLAQDLDPLRRTDGEPLEEPLDEALVRTFALSSAGSLSPMAAMLGAVAAQEVLKVGTGTDRVGLEGVWRSVCMPEGTQHQTAALGASPL